MREWWDMQDSRTKGLLYVNLWTAYVLFVVLFIVFSLTNIA
jgi:hypothetical protein